jgi:plasmid stability protein
MATVTVRKLDDEIVRDLRRSAAERGVSMEQEARDRLRNPLPRRGPQQPDDEDKSEWRLKASLDEILALGRKPDGPIDHKAESDALYDYLDEP